jgi:putative endonuclease
VNGCESANSSRIQLLAPEIARHHQLRKLALIEFDSRQVHQPSLAGFARECMERGDSYTCLRPCTARAAYYMALTSDVVARLEDHNAGRCPHKVKLRPWRLHVVIEFNEEERAVTFERYVKSGRGARSRSGTSNSVTGTNE